MDPSFTKATCGVLNSLPPRNFIEWARFFDGMYGFEQDRTPLSENQAAVKYLSHLTYAKFKRVPFTQGIPPA